MNFVFQLKTSRLLLRQWRSDDYPIFAELNSDPAVMEFFPAPLVREESDALADRIVEKIEAKGWGMWAVESISDKTFLGFVGLNDTDETPLGDAVEIGWRLRRASWGSGYASEAARAALVFAFEMLNLSEVIAFTTVGNLRSRAVMERLGMSNTGQNFMHPRVATDNPLCEHVLYTIKAEQFHSDDPVEIIKVE
ncbi:MAG: GNAT family N-acetyltransferase [Pseudomonadales bacterium]|nr:GNAT family N-acetyltransferase [Pseudomonadales bacterium]